MLLPELETWSENINPVKSGSRQRDKERERERERECCPPPVLTPWDSNTFGPINIHRINRRIQVEK
jgi:hypothetical protein